MKNKFFITGATGFVGSWVTRALVERGEDVSIIVRNKELNWRLIDIADRLNIYECDLQSPHLNEVIDRIKPSIVFHLAAYGALPNHKIDVNQLVDTNVMGVVRLINELKKHKLKLFVNTGSSSEYGIKDKPMKESDLLEPINDYGVTKSAATLFCQKIAKSEQLPIITLRLFSPYGYYDEVDRLIPHVIVNALKNKTLYLSSKKNVRDFVFIEDVIEAYLNALVCKFVPGEIFNIGSGQQQSVYDIVKCVLEITGSKSSVKWGSIQQQSRQIEPKVWQADISKAKRILKWSPKYTLEEGLEKTIEQFKNYDKKRII